MRPRFPEAVRRLRSIVLAASDVLLVGAPSTQARVTRIIIDGTMSVAGHPSYEQLTGRAFGELGGTALALDSRGVLALRFRQELDELQSRIEREPATCWRIVSTILKANINA